MERYEDFNTERTLTEAQKKRLDKYWYKEKLRMIAGKSESSGGLFGISESDGQISRNRVLKTNYDLINNRINKADFDYVCKPFGEQVGQLPADFTNKDILSGKVKALQGMEMKRPFSYKLVAVNEEATTRKEEEEFRRLREYTINKIMEPIRVQAQQQAEAQAQGRELTPDEMQKIQAEVEQQTKAMTPPEVRRYMKREHQDPAEAMGNQLLNYLVKKEDVTTKFNLGWKHSMASSYEIYRIFEKNRHPTLRVVNPMRFDHAKTPDLVFIEDSDWAAETMYLPLAEVAAMFNGELSRKELDKIIEEFYASGPGMETEFEFNTTEDYNTSGVRVMHAEWKSLKGIHFLRGMDPMTGEPYETIVDESYKLVPEAGDIEIVIEWIPTRYEGYMIGRDTFAFLREVPGQHRDLDNLYECKLSYRGAVYDAMNSEPTSIVDRMKYYQYLYNIIFYKVELLLGSDEGKMLLLNINMIPKSAGIDIDKWLYYLKVNKIGLMNPNEEGNKGALDIVNAAKEIDMGLVSQINNYIQLLGYVEERCGKSVGITPQIEGQIGEREAVRNTQQAIAQSVNILEPLFEIHNLVKRNVLTGLLEAAKTIYAETKPKSLYYVLDDMSIEMLNVDYEMINATTYGLFVSNSMKSWEALESMNQLAHAALQNQKIELSDVMKVMRAEDVQQAEEMLVAAEEARIERDQAMQQQQLQAQAEAEEKARTWEREKIQMEHANTLEEIEVKGEIDLQKQAMLSLGFNEDKDLDKDGTPDVLEVYKAGIDAEVKQRKQELDEQKFEHQKLQDAESNSINREKNQIAKKNAMKKNVSK